MDNDERAPAARRFHGDRGASLTEYALLIALIAFVCVGAIQYFGSTNGGSINNSSNSIVTAENGVN
jgi:Flp pilus assembly pilin Flp